MFSNLSSLSLPFFLFLSTSLLLSPRTSANPYAAPPNPDQLYSLQRQAYLEAASQSAGGSGVVVVPTKGVHSTGKKGRRGVGGGKNREMVERTSFERHQQQHSYRRNAHGTVQGGGNKMQKLRRRTTNTFGLIGSIDSSSSSSSHNSLTTSTHTKRGGGTWKGVSSYYLFALDDEPRRQVLDAIKRGGFSVVRIFVAGVHANNKGSGNKAVPDLEPDQVGEYDDTILYKIDKLMADCADRGLKLLIALSDRYALGFWSTNSYAVQLSIVSSSQKNAQSLKVKNAHSFYTRDWAIEMFEKRMTHCLNHENQLMGGRKWKDLSNVVYAFEAQNEPQGWMDNVSPSWVCDRSRSIARQISGSGIQISSGGGIDIQKSLEGWATGCDAIDIVSVHDYGTNGYATAGHLARAKQNHPGKTIMMGEWGLTGTSKASRVKQFVDAFEAEGIPWMYWQITNPGAGSDDFEVWTDEPSWKALTGGSFVDAPPPVKSQSKSSSPSSTSSSRLESSTKSSSSSKSASSTLDNEGGFNSTISNSSYSIVSGDSYSTVTDDSYSTVADSSSYSTVTDFSPTGSESTATPSSASSSKSRQWSKSKSSSWSHRASSTKSGDVEEASSTPSYSANEAQPTKIVSSSETSYENSTSSATVEPSPDDDSAQFSTLSPEEAAQYLSSIVDETSPSTSSSPPSSDGSVSASFEGELTQIAPTATESSIEPLQTGLSSDSSSATATPSTDSSDRVPPLPTNSLPSNSSTLIDEAVSSTVLAEFSTESSSTETTSSADITPTPSAIEQVTATVEAPSIALPTPTLINWIPPPDTILPLPNCNFTLVELNGTHPDANSTVRLLPSGIICNSTLLEDWQHSPSSAGNVESSSSSPLPIVAEQQQQQESAPLLFSSDQAPPPFTQDTMTIDPIISPHTDENTGPSPIISSPIVVPTEGPTPIDDASGWVDVTLGAEALLTMEGYSTVVA